MTVGLSSSDPLQLSSFLQRLAAEFTKRWKEEEDPHCKTPEVRGK